MASTWYPKYKEALLQHGANTNLSTADVRAMIVDLADYTYSAGHEFLSDVPSGARVATSPALGSKTFAGGVFDAADTTATGVTGDESEAVIIYVHTGSDATARLVLFIDSATGLPLTPNGTDVDFVWNPSGIAQL